MLPDLNCHYLFQSFFVFWKKDKTEHFLEMVSVLRKIIIVLQHFLHFLKNTLNLLIQFFSLKKFMILIQNYYDKTTFKQIFADKLFIVVFNPVKTINTQLILNKFNPKDNYTPI